MMYCRSIPTTNDRTDYRKGGNVQSSYERMMYQLSPPPPLFDDLQEYIDLYFDGNKVLYEEAKQHIPQSPY